MTKDIFISLVSLFHKNIGGIDTLGIELKLTPFSCGIH